MYISIKIWIKNEKVFLFWKKNPTNTGTTQGPWIGTLTHFYGPSKAADVAARINAYFTSEQVVYYRLSLFCTVLRNVNYFRNTFIFEKRERPCKRSPVFYWREILSRDLSRRFISFLFLPSSSSKTFSSLRTFISWLRCNLSS